jgi:hypothetical protein
VLDFFSCFRLRAFRDWPLEDNGGDGLTRAANKLSFAGPISVLELDLFVGLAKMDGLLRDGERQSRPAADVVGDR